MSTWMSERAGHGTVLVTGDDATSFLQSLVSQDLDPVGDGEGVASLLLTPQGKLDVLLRMLRVPREDGLPEWWLDCEAGFGAHLAASLDRFRIRVAAEVLERSDTWGLLEIRGADAVARVAAAAEVDVPDASAAHVAWGERRVVRADWPDRPGVDVMGPLTSVDEARQLLLDAGVPAVDQDGYEAARLEAGVARLGVDVDDRTIPQEAFLERDAVSFTKGCFLGQELVCRIDTRGHVNRHLRRLRLGGDSIPERGADVIADGATVGNVTSAASVPGEHGALALAMVRREVVPPAEVAVRWPGGEVSATVEELPGSGS